VGARRLQEVVQLLFPQQPRGDDPIPHVFDELQEDRPPRMAELGKMLDEMGAGAGYL
jgi:hypothetical protein